MRYIVVMLLLMAAVRVCNGAGPVVQRPAQSCVMKVYQPHEQPMTLEQLTEQLNKYKRLKRGGTAMMITGAVLAVAGEVMLFTSLGLNVSGQRNYQRSEDDPLWDGGLACTLTGIGGLGGGVPLYVIANKHIKSLKRKIRNLE